jgi:hypothetical protein
MVWAEQQHSVTGLDINAPLLEVARKRALQAELDIQFDLGTGAQLPYEDASFHFQPTQWLPCTAQHALLRPFRPHRHTACRASGTPGGGRDPALPAVTNAGPGVDCRNCGHGSQITCSTPGSPRCRANCGTGKMRRMRDLSGTESASASAHASPCAA